MGIIRDSFYKTMNHQEVEHLIIDFGGNPLSSMDGKSMYMLMDYLGYDYDKTLLSKTVLFGHVPRIDERILNYLDIDTRSIGTILRPKKSHFKKISDNEYIDEWGIKRIFTGLDWQAKSAPLKGSSIEDLEKYQFPDPETINIKEIENYRDNAKHLYENTDYVICGEHPVYGIFELGCWLCGFDDFMVKMVIDADYVKKFFEKVLEYQKRVIEVYYGIIGPYIHYTSSGDDFATQFNSFISPDMFKDLIKPYLGERISYTKKFTNAKFLHHSCGDVSKLIPHLIDIGVEILNPIQPVNKFMSPEKLKNEYGDKICFHGGLDTQAVLPFGKEEAIKKEVGKLIREMNRNGGYIFAAAHNIQEDVPPENVIKMFKFAREVK